MRGFLQKQKIEELLCRKGRQNKSNTDARTLDQSRLHYYRKNPMYILVDHHIIGGKSLKEERHAACGLHKVAAYVRGTRPVA